MRRRFPHLPALLCVSLFVAGCAGGGANVRAEADAPVPAEAPAQAAAEATDGAAVVEPVAPVADAQHAEDAAVGDDAGDANASAASEPTQAEYDYAAIYGGQVYDPVADPTLPPPAELPEAYDPWEPLNRRVHAFNNMVDETIASPLAHAYVKVVPRPVRLGVRNFFTNLGQPVNALNSLLQGKPKEAGQSIARFLLNATLGIGGLLDPASAANLPYSNEDFGQTLGKWGWRESRYVELPLFGPRTVRDVFGLMGDAPLSPIRQVEDDPTRIFLQGLQLVDVRTQLFAVDSMREGAADDYALVRDAWLQRRSYQIAEDEIEHDESLPEYLREDINNPTVPVDAMPVLPGGD
ncbi:MAG TPA: MlaA family lipoprotein [Luteimonas sp.]|nr:MlaA family lipoprotein [Luteimonas sp.]